MGIFYDKLLKKNQEDAFQFINLIDFEPCEDIANVLHCFFSNRQKGVHVAIICTDVTNVLMTSDDFSKLLKEKSGRSEEPVVIKFDEDFSPDSQNGCYCFISNASNLPDALNTVYKCVKHVVGNASNINSKAEQMITAIKVFSEHLQHPPEVVWTRKTAENISPLMNQEETSPDIRILMILPLNTFDIFARDDCYFPIEFEYVVRGQSTAAVYKELISLREFKKRVLQHLQSISNFIQSFALKNKDLYDLEKEEGHMNETFGNSGKRVESAETSEKQSINNQVANQNAVIKEDSHQEQNTLTSDETVQITEENRQLIDDLSRGGK